MQKSKKINILLIILLILIPNLLISIQRDIGIYIDEKNPNEIINTRPPQESFVYYEDTTGTAIKVYVSGNYAYVADYFSGLAVIDISDPTNPGTPVYEDTDGQATGVFVSGGYAYVTDYTSGLAVIDISNPTNPGTPDYEATLGDAYDVYVSGDYAYVADYFSGLAVIDISDPTNPGILTYEATLGPARGVYVSGDYAYMAVYTSGLAVIDISDPSNPGALAYEDTTGLALDVYVSGDYAYVASAASGLAVIDISNPANPGMPVYEATAGTAQDVYVSGDYAYVADDTSGLAVIDISDPTNPGAPIYEDTTGIAYGVYVSGDYAYVADDTSGLAVIDIVDMEDPIISNAPSDFTVEFGYTGQSLSWTATDPYPNTYTIELQGSGIVAGPTAWTSGVPIIYNIPDGFAVGVYVYTVNFTDDYGHSIIDSVTFTVEDTTNPTIISTPSDFTVEFGYTGQSLSWTATDPYPNTYTIELQGMGIVTGPTTWTSGIAINYNIPDGFSIGSYIYTVNFTDDYGNFATDSVTFIVEDTTNPVITDAPSDLPIEFGYTGQSLSWNATDPHPNTYTIELQGSGIVAGPTAWTSGIAITYNIPEGFAVGDYVYMVNFTDDYGNFKIDSVTFTVEDTANPVITDAPSDFTVEYGYTGQSLSWTATDPSPNTYTIELQGTGIVAGPTAWTSGIVITYNIPDGFSVGSHIYTINFTDSGGNYDTDSVTFTVEVSANPVITDAPNDFTVEYGYTGQSLSWTATDFSPNSYTIEFQGTGFVAGPTAWTSGIAIIYNIPDDFAVGVHVYTVNFTDDYGNFKIDSVTFTVEDTTKPIITINFPNLSDEFATSAPAYNISISEPHLDQIWYTLDDGITNISITFLSGSIDQTVWDGVSLGSVTLVFYANDTLGNIGFMSVGISKITGGEGEPSEPPNLLGTIATVLSIIGGTFTVLGILYRTIYTGKVKPKKWAKKLKSSRDEKIRFHAASKLKKSKSTNSIVISALKKAAYDSSEKTEIRNLAKEALKERGIFVND